MNGENRNVLLTLRCLAWMMWHQKKLKLIFFSETDNPDVCKTLIRKFELSFLVKVFLNQHTVPPPFDLVISGTLSPFPNIVKVIVNRSLMIVNLLNTLKKLRARVH